MDVMDIQYLRDNDLIIFECISGSRAYGLATEQSDVDIKGVFILPEDRFFGFTETEQVCNKSNDVVFFEVKKFLSLVAKNNPNILEMLYTPSDFILHESDVFKLIKKHNFLSRLCHETFVRYAFGQIKKARGLNKKIVAPMAKNRQTILDFCFIIKDKGSEKLTDWLLSNGFSQEDCGLTNVPHFPNVYQLYHAVGQGFNGILSNKNATKVNLSSIPKQFKPLGYLFFNEDSYKAHCKQFKEYWDWVKIRNEDRYKTNISHGKNYDSKNMMHVFRLLNIAFSIAKNGTINLQDSDRDFLLKIKSGEFQYDFLIRLAEERVTELNELFKKSVLPETPNFELIESVLVNCRKIFYQNY